MADPTKEKTEGFMTGLLALVKQHFAAPAKEIFKMVKLKDGREARYQFANVKTKDGAEIAYDGETPMEGMPIMVIPSDGTDPIAPADGVLVFEDGTEVEVKGGVIVAVKPAAGAAPPPTGDMTTPTNVSATEAAAKKVIESTIKETVFSKQEVLELIDKQKTEFEVQVKSVSEKFDVAKSENGVLTKKISEVSADNTTLKTEVEKFKSFAEGIPKLLEEFGATPQVKETEAEKKAKAEAFASEKPKKLTDAEWRAKYIK